jgi:hypothetical protein
MPDLRVLKPATMSKSRDMGMATTPDPRHSGLATTSDPRRRGLATRPAPHLVWQPYENKNKTPLHAALLLLKQNDNFVFELF